MPRAKKNTVKTQKKVVKIARALAPVLAGKGAYKTKKTRARGIRGRGGFFGDLWDTVKSPFVDNGKFSVSKTLGSLSSAGALAAKLAPMLAGFGAYHVKKNSLWNKAMSPAGDVPTNSVPVMGSSFKGADIVLAHREYVADVKSSINFSTTTYPLNPGNDLLFPWLSKVGVLFEEYEFLGMVLEYKSTSAAAVGTVTSGMGVVIMATDYDVEDANYLDKRSMEAAEFASSAVPYTSFLHPIECDPRRNVLTRNYVVPDMHVASDAPGDPRLSVLGNTTIATQGQQTDGDVIGELWISYHVRLSRPILEGVNVRNAYQLHYGGAINHLGNFTFHGLKTTDAAPWIPSVAGANNTFALTFTNGNANGTYQFIASQREESGATTGYGPTGVTAWAVTGGPITYPNKATNPLAGFDTWPVKSSPTPTFDNSAPTWSWNSSMIVRSITPGDVVYVPLHWNSTAEPLAFCSVDVYIIKIDQSFFTPRSQTPSLKSLQDQITALSSSKNEATQQQQNTIKALQGAMKKNVLRVSDSDYESLTPSEIEPTLNSINSSSDGSSSSSSSSRSKAFINLTDKNTQKRAFA